MIKKKKRPVKAPESDNKFIPTMRPIERITNEATKTKLFRLKHPIDHEPGQFVEVSIMGIGECPISICSYSDTHIELCIRDVGQVTDKLFTLKEKDKIGVRGPYGKGYPMQEFHGKNLLFIGGGTGVAPLRGAIKYAEQNKQRFGDIELFFGFRTPEDILFKRDIERWKNMFKLNLTVDQRSPGWRGKVGLITELLDKNKLQVEDTAVILCGPPIMIKFVLEKLKSKGFRKEQIWMSLERMMKCGMGKCGRCQVGNKYVCKDGPVFHYPEIEDMKGE